jgi:hypothetical protein
MPRINVWVPDELHRTIKLRLPGLNVSAVVQGALAAQLDCTHEQLTCSSCSTPIDHRELIGAALNSFYSDALWDLEGLVRTCGTAEGAARVLKETALRHRISDATHLPLPRPTRANRHAAKVTTMPTEAESRGRHPTARRHTA